MVHRAYVVAGILGTCVLAAGPAAAAEDLCAMERSARNAQGITEDGPICQALQNPQSALSRTSSINDDDLFQCKVVLCMAATDGPESIAECQDTINAFKRSLRRGGRSQPSCPLVWADDQGGGGVSHTVDNRGQVRENEGDDRPPADAEGTTVVSSEGLDTISGYAEQAYQLYGAGPCNDVETMIEHMGSNTVLGATTRAQPWMQGGTTHTAYVDWAQLPEWFRGEYPQYAGYPAWNQLLPWFTVLALEENNPGAAAVQLGGMSIQYFSRSREQWVVLGNADTYVGSTCPRGVVDTGCGDLPLLAGPDGLPAFVNGANGADVSGSWEMLELVEPGDVQAITVTAEARLVGDNATTARHGLIVGADFYPGIGALPMLGMSAGNSRLIPLGPEWTNVSFTTLTTAVSSYSGGRGLTEAELQANAPACDTAP